MTPYPGCSTGAGRKNAVSVPRFDDSLFVDYETDALVAAAQEHPLSCLVVPDLIWAEIDDEPAFARAKRSIYPRLVMRDDDGHESQRSPGRRPSTR